jgi:Methyltransferase domain
MSDAFPCRLCGGATRTQFTLQVLGAHPCRYLVCDACGSLQTEPPYWLAEAYRDSHLTALDTGVFWRCNESLGIVWLTARLLRLPRRARVVDYGGGSGLLCRMLRDIGFDARVSDRYARNDIARGFDDLGETPDIMCAFEVAEHFAEPRQGMGEILGRGAAACIVGTETYRGQGRDWWYLGPSHGQHVVFYSPAGMQMLAEAHGYAYARVTNLHFFFRRPLSRWQSSLLWRGMAPGAQRLVRTWLALGMTRRYADADNRAAVRQAEMMDGRRE